MPKGDRYIVGGTLGVYATASDAINRRNKASDLKDNWNSVEGDGTPYINNFSGWGNYHPAVPIWWVPSWGGSGYEIGWVNDNDNYQATTPSVSPATTTMGNTMTISLPRNHSSITHRVEYDFYGAKGVIATSAGTSTTWTPSISLADKIPNATTGTGTITAKTYGGGRLVGTKTCSFKLSVPSTVVPTLSHVVSEGVSGLATKFGAYIQNHSKAKVVNTASGARSSTIKSIVTTVDGKNYSGATITSGFLTSSGSVSVKTVVTDSRGRTATTTTTISVSAYTSPRIQRFTAFRSNSSGTQLDDGTFLQVNQKFTVTSLASKNDKSWKVEYRRATGGSWATVSSGSVYTYDSAFTSSTAILDTQYSYDIRLTVSDYFSSATLMIMVGTAFDYISVSVEGKGIAIGKVSEKPNTFEVALPAEFTGPVKVDGALTAGGLSLPDGIVDDSSSYRQILSKGGRSTGYFRTPASGMLPDSKSDTSARVGTSDWPFYRGYFSDNVYIDGAEACTWGSGRTMDISSSFTKASGVTNFYARRWGRVINMSFEYKPTVGWNSDVITFPNSIAPFFRQALSVSSARTASDLTKGVVGYIYPTSVSIVAQAAPSYEMMFSVTYIM